MVIGNWLTPPDDLHLGRLFGDEVVCLVARDHPAVRRESQGGWDQASWLAAEHIAPTPTHPGARGVIDEHLDSLGLQRNITARCPHFGLIPSMVASTLLVLTTGRQYCERYVDKLPVQNPAMPDPVSAPVVLPALARAHARVQRRPLAARAGQGGGRIASERIANNDHSTLGYRLKKP